MRPNADLPEWARVLRAKAHLYIESLPESEVAKKWLRDCADRILRRLVAARVSEPTEITPPVLIESCPRYNSAKIEHLRLAVSSFGRFLVGEGVWKAAVADRLEALWKDRYPGRGRVVVLKAKLPFARPRCSCGRLPNVEKTPGPGETRWYFECPGCKKRFWSTDGTLHPVGRRAWRDFSDRPTCPQCKVECVVYGSPGRRSRLRFWRCPKCGERYHSVEGKVVPVRSNHFGARKPVPGLRDENRVCPWCNGTHVRIKSHPPWSRYYYFACWDCRQNSRLNRRLGQLVRVRPWAAARKENLAIRRKPVTGEKTHQADDRINQYVEERLPRLEEGHRLFVKLRKGHPANSDLWGHELAKAGFQKPEVDALLRSRTPRTAAERIAAHKFSVSLHRVQNACSLRGKAPKT